jgi:hypothetical protein
LVASANAYLSALNKMIIKRQKIAPIEQNNEKSERDLNYGNFFKHQKNLEPRYGN